MTSTKGFLESSNIMVNGQSVAWRGLGTFYISERLVLKNRPHFPWPSTRKRKKPILGTVLHHQGGEGNRHTLARVLRKRGYSIHFGVDAYGNVTQYADPVATVCLHAGKANAQWIGIEVANRAVPRGVRLLECTLENSVQYEYDVDRPRRRRRVVVREVHGRSREMLDFRKHQIDAVEHLILAVHGRLGLGTELPTGYDGELITTTFPGAVEHKGGLLCHFHLTKRKWDPVPHLPLELMERWGQKKGMEL